MLRIHQLASCCAFFNWLHAAHSSTGFMLRIHQLVQGSGFRVQGFKIFSGDGHPAAERYSADHPLRKFR